MVIQMDIIHLQGYGRHVNRNSFERGYVRHVIGLLPERRQNRKSNVASSPSIITNEMTPPKAVIKSCPNPFCNILPVVSILDFVLKCHNLYIKTP